MKYKTFDFEIKGAEPESGEFRGYASAFSVIDSQGDVVLPGAFAADLVQNKGQIPILWQHRPDQPIGKTLSATEDSYGLQIHGKLLDKLEKARETFLLVKEGIVRGLSIGYEPVKWAWRKGMDGVRDLHEIKLYEISLCMFPANEGAQVLDAKTLWPTVRDFESWAQKELGLSQRQACALASRGWAGLSRELEIDSHMETELRQLLQ